MSDVMAANPQHYSMGGFSYDTLCNATASPVPPSQMGVCELFNHRGQAAFPIFLSAPQSGPGRSGPCSIRHRLGRRFLGAFLTGCRKSAAVQNRRIKRDRLEGADLGLPLDNQGQRWGHHTPDVQSAVVQHAEKPGGIDPHQPVGFGPAQGGRIQPVIVAARLEGRKALPDGGILPCWKSIAGAWASCSRSGYKRCGRWTLPRARHHRHSPPRSHRTSPSVFFSRSNCFFLSEATEYCHFSSRIGRSS